MSDIGNINAIREWTRRYFYTKEDINYFISKLNEGYKGYALTIIGPKNKKVVITPGNYEFTLNSDGWYRYIFFFSQGQEITLEVEDGDTMTYQLDTYIDTINVSPYVIATPQHLVGESFKPSGYTTTSGGGNGAGAFDRIETDAAANVADITPIVNGWICYEFPEPTVIYKCKFILYPFGAHWDPARPTHFDLQVSNDTEQWSAIYTFQGHIDPTSNEFEFFVTNPGKYLYYRIWIYEGETGYNGAGEGSGRYTRFKEIYYYTVDESTLSYQIATPIMTSNTQPTGEVTVNSGGGTNGWQLFNQDQNTGVWSSTVAFNAQDLWVCYKFPSPKIIRRVEVWNNSNLKQFVIQGSNDNDNWVSLGTCTMRHTEDYYYQPTNIDNSIPYLYYRLLITDAFTVTSAVSIRRIDLMEAP